MWQRNQSLHAPTVDLCADPGRSRAVSTCRHEQPSACSGPVSDPRRDPRAASCRSLAAVVRLLSGSLHTPPLLALRDSQRLQARLAVHPFSMQRCAS